jgi:hypothetical protein
MATQAPGYSLAINEAERAELLRVLEQFLQETHMERRRTEAPAYQQEVSREEALLRNLTEKVRRLGQ